MKAKVNNIEVEGTPEEIAKFLGMKYSPESHTSQSYIPNSCKACPNYGKGPCLCTIPYITGSGYTITC